MSGSHSAKEIQEVIQCILNLKSPPLDYFAERCSDSTTPGRLCEPCMQLEAVDAKLYAYFEEIKKLLKIQAEAKQRVNQHHDPLTRIILTRNPLSGRNPGFLLRLVEIHLHQLMGFFVKTLRRR